MIAPAEEQPGSHVPSGPPRRRTDGTQMFTQFLGTAATVYGVLAALKRSCRHGRCLTRRTSREVSALFLASYTGGYAIWLIYGLSTGGLPLIVVDTVGLWEQIGAQQLRQGRRIHLVFSLAEAIALHRSGCTKWASNP